MYLLTEICNFIKTDLHKLYRVMNLISKIRTIRLLAKSFSLICIVILMLVLPGCEKQEMNSEIDMLVEEFNLQQVCMEESKPMLHFSSIEEARGFLSNRNPAERTIKIDLQSDLDLNRFEMENQAMNFSFIIYEEGMGSNTKLNTPHLKEGSITNGDYFTTFGYGLLSELVVEFSTSNGCIETKSVDSFIRGVAIVKWEQKSVLRDDCNSFGISGQAYFTIGIGDMSFDIIDHYILTVDVDFRSMIATLSYQLAK